jgi:hypothetical protein
MRLAVVVLAALCVERVSAGAPPLRPALEHVLTADLGFLPADVDEVRAGGIVARVVATGDGKEVAVAGAMHSSASLDYYVTRLANVGIPSTPSAPDTGRFSRPAVESDLAAWPLSPSDLRTLSLCTARDCGFRLDADTLTRLRAEAGPRPALAVDDWTHGVRAAIATYVTAFQAGGASQLPSFPAGRTPIVPADAFAVLRSRFTFLEEPFPDLMAFIAHYPGNRSVRGLHDERFVWSVEVVRSTPVLTATHLLVWTGAGSMADALLVSEQIYTSRDVDALVEVTLVAADQSPEQPGATVVMVSRSLSTSLQGMMGAIIRQPVRAAARAALETYMTTIRTAFEHDAPH